MNTFRLALRVSLFLVAITAFASLAQAQATRTWVSGVGDDVNPCSRTAPCKTFAGAISKTATGGEMNTLDSGGFGTIIIKKSITIDGTGSLSSILAAGTTGITIDITDVKEVAKTVRIRGLSINGAGTGLQGIQVIAASRVSIEDTVIDGFKTNGLNVAAGQVFVRNTTISNNGGAGINVASQAAQVAISDVSVIFNEKGLAGSVTQFSNVVMYGNKN
jgi:hypothetical protein